VTAAHGHAAAARRGDQRLHWGEARADTAALGTKAKCWRAAGMSGR
jgi:hypothetical protein